MSGRVIILLVAGIAVISGLIMKRMGSTSSSIMANFGGYYLHQTSQDLAQSAVNLGLRRLNDDNSWRTGYPLTSALGGKFIVAAFDTTFAGRPAVGIRGTGIAEYGSSIECRSYSVAFIPKVSIPLNVKAAITTNNDVSTLGNLTVDGRDHTSAGVLVAGSGKLGVWTTQTMSQGGSSDIGGTAGGVDYAPAKPANPNVIAAGQTYPGGYPGTPDSLLGGIVGGFPEGTLKAIAQSHAGGSQYVTNPGLLTAPLKGVTYVELPSGGTWQSMDLTGSGILIVHNAAKNAAMKNLNSGTFTGLVIADDVIHVHTAIIGALIVLSPNPSSGNTIGNGNGSVLYSSQAILNAVSVVGTSSTGSASKVIGWWE